MACNDMRDSESKMSASSKDMNEKKFDSSNNSSESSNKDSAEKSSSTGGCGCTRNY